MRKLKLFTILLFVCGVTRSQIYTPTNPTTYGSNNLRLKATTVQHIPVSSDTLLNTNDTSAQIRIIQGRLRYHYGIWKYLADSFDIAQKPTYQDVRDIVSDSIANKANIDTNLINTRKFYGSPKLSNWFKKFSISPSTAKLIFVGNSTSDFTGNANSIPSIIKTYTNSGNLLAGFDTSFLHMPNFGSSGNTIVNFYNDSVNTASKGIAGVIAAAPDLIIFSYGINDIRQNQLTKDQLKNYVIACINKIRAALPNTDIVLRMPNSFLTSNAGGFIQQGSYPSIAVAAQAQSDTLYQAYKELDNYWDNVPLLNTQDLIFGRTALATSNLMTDGIHPVYSPIISELVKIVGYKQPFSLSLASNAYSVSPSTPWTVYPYVFEDSTRFTKITEGILTQTGTYFDLNVGADSLGITNYQTGDIIVYGSQYAVLNSTFSNTGGGLQIYRMFQVLGFTNVNANAVAKIYRYSQSCISPQKKYAGFLTVNTVIPTQKLTVNGGASITNNSFIGYASNYTSNYMLDIQGAVSGFGSARGGLRINTSTTSNGRNIAQLTNGITSTINFTAASGVVDTLWQIKTLSGTSPSTIKTIGLNVDLTAPSNTSNVAGSFIGGNVGVGTQTPTYMLDVIGNTSTFNAPFGAFRVQQSVSSNGRIAPMIPSGIYTTFNNFPASVRDTMFVIKSIGTGGGATSMHGLSVDVSATAATGSTAASFAGGAVRVSDTLSAGKIVRIGGTSSQFLKADGSIDATAYAPISSPTFTGTVTLPTTTGTAGTDSVLVKTSGGVIRSVSPSYYSTLTSSVIGGSVSASVTAVTTFVVSPATQANANYQVIITPSNMLSAVNYYVTNKTTTSFDVVFVSALTGTVAFDWILKP